MPKAPRTPEGDAPKKRTGKTPVATEDNTKVLATTNGATKKPRIKKPVDAPIEIPVVPAPDLAAPVAKAVQPPSAKEVVQIPAEERIRFRAYELYLRRGGRGGSPEQDWFQAAAEIYGESVA